MARPSPWSLLHCPRRVVVTGMGAVTPFGLGVDKMWSGVRDGKSAPTTIDLPHLEAVPAKIAGVVPGYNAEDHFDKGDLRELPRFIQFALLATKEALANAHLNPAALSESQRERTGVAIGAGMGCLDDIVDVGALMAAEGYRKVSPFFVPRILVNMAAGHVSIRHKLKGPNHAVSTACATSSHALGDAANFIRMGYADVMIAGGTESSVTAVALAGFSRLRALASNFNERPTAASRPFDKDRSGFVMSEGAGILVLEEREHALARGATILAELAGYGLSGDGHHITTPAPDGHAAYRAMRDALLTASIAPSSVDCLNAHATSTPVGDSIELAAVTDLFFKNSKEARPKPLFVSSSKGALGHLLGAAGAVEAAVSVLTLVNNTAPPTANLSVSDCGELYHPSSQLAPSLSTPVLNTAAVTVPTPLEVVVTNSFGFGGTHSSLVFTTRHVSCE